MPLFNPTTDPNLPTSRFGETALCSQLDSPRRFVIERTLARLSYQTRGHDKSILAGVGPSGQFGRHSPPHNSSLFFAVSVLNASRTSGAEAGPVGSLCVLSY